MESRCYDESMKCINGSKSYRSKKTVILLPFGCVHLIRNYYTLNLTLLDIWYNHKLSYIILMRKLNESY